MWDQHWPACVVTSGHTVRENRLGRKLAPLGVLRGGWARAQCDPLPSYGGTGSRMGVGRSPAGKIFTFL